MPFPEVSRRFQEVHKWIIGLKNLRVRNLVMTIIARNLALT